jgi:hypothetical protein
MTIANVRVHLALVTGVSSLLAAGVAVADATSEVMPATYGLIAVHRNLGQARLGEPALVVNTPDDADDTYLARRPVDEGSLTWLRARRGREVTVIRPDGGLCSAHVGPIAAYAWAMPEGTRANEWEKLTNDVRGPLLFKQGTTFLGAEIPESICNDAEWAVLAQRPDVEFFKPEPAPAPLRSLALKDSRRIRAFASRQRAYDRFRRAESALSVGQTNSAQKAAPSYWIDLDGTTTFWLVRGPRVPTLLVGYLERKRVPNQPATAHSPDRDDVLAFYSTVVAVWIVSHEPTTRVTYVGPYDGAGINGEFRLSGALRTKGRLPLLLYSTNRLSSVLRENRGQYRVDKRTSFGPRSIVEPTPPARGSGARSRESR